MSDVPDILVRLEKAAHGATYNAVQDRQKGFTAFAAHWDQIACVMEDAAAEIKRLRGRKLRPVKKAKA